MGSTPLYDRFWQNRSGKEKYDDMEGGAGQPLGAQNKGIQESMLENLQEIAESGDGIIDDWPDHVDAAGTYDENKQRLLDMSAGESPFKVDRKRNQEKREAKAESIPDIGPEFTHDPRYEEPYVMEDPFGDEGLKSIEGGSENKTGEKPVVTNPRDYEQGDEYGFHRIAVSTPLVSLLDRIKDEYELKSRRAAIEAVLSQVDIEHFQDEHGETWPEWIETFQASREFRVDIREKENSPTEDEFL